MKTIIAVLGLIISGALVAEHTVPASANSMPIIIKNNYSGYVAPDWNRSESCTVFTDGTVMIEKTYGMDAASGGVGAIVMTDVLLSKVKGDLAAMAKVADSESIVAQPNMLCDGPSTVIKTFVERSEITLYSTGGCGSDRQERNGPASRILVDIVDAYCATTH